MTVSILNNLRLYVSGTTYQSAKEDGKAKLDMAAVYSNLRDKNTR
ncbi:hypothetical protein FH5_00213 [Priestia endophytica]|jgi:hypothetical protein|nr:hypothetical protein FH5_00213 [Priestia endophytica]